MSQQQEEWIRLQLKALGGEALQTSAEFIDKGRFEEALQDMRLSSTAVLPWYRATVNKVLSL
jgi:hypothetical protein